MIIGKKEDIAFKRRLLDVKVKKLRIRLFLMNPLVFSFYTSQLIIGLHIGPLRIVYSRG